MKSSFLALCMALIFSVFTILASTVFNGDAFAVCWLSSLTIFMTGVNLICKAIEESRG